MKHELELAITNAWLKAQKELSIQVVSPFEIQAKDGSLILYSALIKDFGSPKGTLVLTEYNDANTKYLAKLAKENGYYFSILYNSYTSFDKELFIDTLNDWGWFSKNQVAPIWYSRKEWTS